MKTTLNVGGLAGEDVRFWFDETVRAEFDYELAYDDYLITLLPRWGGNIPAMIRFGHECADSGRYDTQVPLFIDSVVSWLLVEIGSYQTIFRSEDVYRTCQTVLKNYVEHSKNEPSKRYYRSLRACLAWQGQRLGEFRQIATNLGNEFDSRAYRKFQMKPDEVRQALDMLQAPPQGKFPNLIRRQPGWRLLPTAPRFGRARRKGKSRNGISSRANS